MSHLTCFHLVYTCTLSFWMKIYLGLSSQCSCCCWPFSWPLSVRLLFCKLEFTYEKSVCVTYHLKKIICRAPYQSGQGRGYSRGQSGRGRRTPDYKIHPEKWTMYSLEDVDTSDSANKQAALEFLNVNSLYVFFVPFKCKILKIQL